MGDRLEEIKARTKKTDGMLSYDLQWMAAEIKNLRQAAHADQLVIQRLRREVDHWVAIAKSAAPVEALDAGLRAENHRLAALTGSLATEAEALKRERDEFRAKLARANQYAASRAGRVPR